VSATTHNIKYKSYAGSFCYQGLHKQLYSATVDCDVLFKPHTLYILTVGSNFYEKKNTYNISTCFTRTFSDVTY